MHNVFLFSEKRTHLADVDRLRFIISNCVRIYDA